MKEIQVKSILVRVSARFQLARVLVIGIQLYSSVKGGISYIPWCFAASFCFLSSVEEHSRVSREIFNDLNFKMQLIQGKFQWALLIFGIWLIM